jgi:hypothetical protein
LAGSRKKWKQKEVTASKTGEGLMQLQAMDAATHCSLHLLNVEQACVTSDFPVFSILIAHPFRSFRHASGHCFL